MTETIVLPHTTSSSPVACCIWLHGLGASAQDMAGLAQALALGNRGVKHVCLQAPTMPVTINMGYQMPAWYDIYGSDINQREDKAGIQHSEKILCQAIEEQIEHGFTYKQIFLAGFSQGGAMVLYSGLRIKAYLGGIICLSAYLTLANELNPVSRKSIPIFFAYGQKDEVVIPDWSQASIRHLEQIGYSRISTHQYSMGHEVCPQEVSDIRSWLNARLAL